MVRGFHHVAIQARDVEGLAAFYREVFGRREQRRWNDDSGALRSIWLACGDGFLAIERAGEGPLPSEQPFRTPAPGIHVFALGIAWSDRVAVERELTAAKVVIEHRTQWSLFVRDPEGNRIALTHYPEAI